jgi:hypothetical protein
MNTETITIYIIKATDKYGSEGQNVITTTLPEGLRELTQREWDNLDECYAFSGTPTIVYQKQLTMTELAEGITFNDMREEIIGAIG